jgi:hypothetical protein
MNASTTRIGLTAYRHAATVRAMTSRKRGDDRVRYGMNEGWGAARTGGLVLLAAGALALGGCISVKAPDKPIVIELNINIKQEVVYRLAGDASQTIDKNKDIF